VYVTSWSVIAASDGHVTAGEFAFAVGDAEGAVPAGQASAGTVNRWAVATGWLVLAGMSLAAGALAAGTFLPIGGEHSGVLLTLSRTGLLAAAVGAGAQLPLLGLLATGGDDKPLWWSVPGIATIAAVAVLALALILVTASPGRHWALGLVALAGALWSARGHAAAYGGMWSGVVDFVHLAAAAVWMGTLAVVAVLLWRTRHEGRKTLLAVVRPYSRLALWLVVTVVVTGVVSAYRLVGSLAALSSSGYGLVLVGKLTLVAVVVTLAGCARLWWLPRRRLGRLRRVTTVEVGVLAGVLAATAILGNLGPPAGQAAAAELLGPAPMQGPVAQAAGLAGNLNVALAAGDGRLRVEVLAPSGPVERTDVLVSAKFADGRDATLRPRPCGEGCWEQQLDLPDGVTRVTVDAGAPEWDGGRFTGELTWPPAPEQPELLRAVIERMRAVPWLELAERVTSHSDQAGAITETALTGEEFIALEPYAAGEVVDVRSVGDRVIEFSLPASRMLFTLWLDEQGRIREERIVNPGHEIRRTLTYTAEDDEGSSN
jgi:copper transport protein